MSDIPSTEERSLGRLILPSLVLSRFATQPPGILTGLLLIDIGLTFGYAVGVIGQIRTLSSTIAVIFALLMGVLSVRFKRKSLLMMGLLFFSISALGCYLAPSFNAMLLSYSLSGVGMAMVTPMSTTLVGEYLPLEKRPSAIGWIIAGLALSYLIGAPAISFIAGIAGWRLAFLGFVLPISLLGLFLAFNGIPSTSPSPKPTISGGNYLEGFKKVFSNKSAVACLMGTTLAMAGWQAILLYGASFFRERFMASTGLASMIILGGALCYLLGSLVGGRFVIKFGRKNFTVLSAFFLGVITVSYPNFPILWLSLVLMCLGSTFAGMWASASNSLTLEQVPKFRGTMMSISSASTSLGSAFGAGVGGLSLILYDYGGLGISLGALSIVAAVVFQLLAIDPART